MAYKIIWSLQALEDLRSVTEFIAANDTDAAERFGLSLLHRVENLAEHPMMGSVVPERKDKKIRQLLVGAYRIVYHMNSRAKTVQVWRVWHGARGKIE